MPPPCPGIWQGSSSGIAESGTTLWALHSPCCGAGDSQHPQHCPPSVPRAGSGPGRHQDLGTSQDTGPGTAVLTPHTPYAFCQWLCSLRPSTICPIPKSPGVVLGVKGSSLGAGWRWPQPWPAPTPPQHGRAVDPQVLPSGQCQNAGAHGPPQASKAELRGLAALRACTVKLCHMTCRGWGDI